MATINHLLLVTLVLISFSALATAAETGTATFYTPPYTPSACNGLKNDGVMIAAVSDAFWNGGSACGRTLKVKCVTATNLGVPHPCKGDGTVVVRIVDYCPAGCRCTIDLSQEAFASIADPDAGKINIAFQRLRRYGASTMYHK